MQRNIRVAVMVVIDILLIIASFVGAFLIRFEGTFDYQYLQVFIDHIIEIIAIKLLVL